MHTSEEAFESEAQAISILKQWALSSERDELEVGLLSDCLAARKDGTDFVPVPNYIWGLTSNDVVWELRGAGDGMAFYKYQFISNPLVRGEVGPLPYDVSETHLMAHIKASFVTRQIFGAASLARKCRMSCRQKTHLFYE